MSVDLPIIKVCRKILLRDKDTYILYIGTTQNQKELKILHTN